MKNSNDMSLMTLLRDDPELSRRIKEVAKEIQKDDVKVRTIAEEYNRKYNREIVEGTRRKHILLEDGKKRGKSVEEIECSSGFIPSVYTPILNWLYFFIIEGRNPEREYLREEQDKLQARFKKRICKLKVKNYEYRGVWINPIGDGWKVYGTVWTINYRIRNCSGWT